MISPTQDALIRELKKRYYSYLKIGDFSDGTTKNKRQATGSQMLLLQALLNRAREENISRLVLQEEYLTDYTVLDTIIAEDRLPLPSVLIPSWENAPHSAWLACMQAVMLLDHYDNVWCFTANLRDDIVEASGAAAKSGPSYYHDRVHRELSKLGDARFWQAIEWTKGKHHFHGAVLFEDEVAKVDIRKSLRLACGEYEPDKRGPQVKLKPPKKGDELNWGYYSRKKPLVPETLYGDRPFSYSHGLAGEARKLYDLIRAYLNNRRIGR